MPFGLSENFLENLRNRIQTYFGGSEKPPTEQPHVDKRLIGPADGIDQIMYRVRYGGRTNTKLWMKYNNTWRHVEPYSFRYRSAGMQPLFFAWCDLHDEIHSFRIDRIQDIHTTGRPFSPRFAVEIS